MGQSGLSCGGNVLLPHLSMCKLIILSALISLCLAQRGRRPPTADQLPPIEPQQQADLDPYYASECPASYGFYADAEQCDKYYKCENWTITEKFCKDGMGFVDFHPGTERCDFLFNVDCADIPKLQAAKQSEHCPRANGFFPHENPKTCEKFYQCSDGRFSALDCPPALIFDLKTGTCAWPEQAGRQGCSASDVLEFECPPQTPDEARRNLHPRYADDKDCQFFFVCLNGKIPRRNGCPFAKVYDIESESCSDPDVVPECATWYDGNPEYEALKKAKTQIRIDPAKSQKVIANKRRRQPVQRPAQAPVQSVQRPVQRPVQPQAQSVQRPFQDTARLLANSRPVEQIQDDFQSFNPGRSPTNSLDQFQSARPVGRVPVKQDNFEPQRRQPAVSRQPINNRPSFQRTRPLPPQEEHFADEAVQDVPVRRRFQTRRTLIPQN